MRIVFVRHGEPDYAHDCLTENGVEQAKCTAERLMRENISVIYASPMGRARETASFTAGKLNLEVNVLDFMHEIDWGSQRGDERIKRGNPWEMATLYKCELKKPEDELKWRKSPYFKDNLCLEYYDMISRETDEFLKTLGYERDEVGYRELERSDKTVALFAHGGSGACFLSHVLNIPFPTMLSALPYGVCSVSVIELYPVMENYCTPRIESFGDMNHILEAKSERIFFEK